MENKEEATLRQRRPGADENTDRISEVKPGNEPAPEVKPKTEPWWQHVRLEVWMMSSIVVLCGLALYALYREPPASKRVFDATTLAFYTGKKNSPMYLAILGEVYDVTKGAKHYGGGNGTGGYAFFLGRDASRGFVTGDFKNDLNDDVKGLTPEQCATLLEWRSFYRKEYVYKGKLAGKFYNVKGERRLSLTWVEEQAAKAVSEEEARRKMEAQFPRCNVRWNQEEGGHVWCDNGWHPRKIFSQLPGGKPTTRCACFKDIGWSDVRQIYPDCAPEATQCQVSKPGAKQG